MPFLDHLEELRWRILKALAALVVGAVICFAFSDSIMQILTRPYEEAVLSLESQQSSGVVLAVKKLVQPVVRISPMLRPNRTRPSPTYLQRAACKLSGP